MTGSVQLQSYQAPNASEVSPLINQRGQQAGDGRSLFAKAAASLGGALVKTCKIALHVGKDVAYNALVGTRLLNILPLALPYAALIGVVKLGLGDKRMKQLGSDIKGASGPLLWPVLKSIHKGLVDPSPRIRPIPSVMALIR